MVNHVIVRAYWHEPVHCFCRNSLMRVFYLHMHDKHLSWPVMSVEWGGDAK